MSINQTLLDLYQTKWDVLCFELSGLDSKKYTSPFLLAFDDTKYRNSELKVMIFGQETKGWFSHLQPLRSVNDISSQYNTFFNLKKFYSGYGRSSFWKAFRYFERELSTTYPNKNIYFSWNNINKIGKLKGTGTDSDVEKIEKELFSVVLEEVQLFNPDIVIFLTGPNRDSKIKFHFEDAEFTALDPSFKIRELARVSSKFLPKNTVRMYHPSYFGGFYRTLPLATSSLTL